MIYAYFILIFLLGIYNNKNISNNDYLYLSRKLTLPSFVATIVTTWYGGILEIGRFSYLNGIVTWVIFGLFYYISAIIFAIFIAPKLSTNNIQSIPKYFGIKYGNTSRRITSIVLIFLSSPAPYLMILSTLLIHILDISTNQALIFGILFSITYIYSGGLKSIIKTDIIQFIFMYSGFFVILIYLIINFGGFEFLITNLPDEHLNLSGKFPLGYILSWSLISMITFIDPSIFHRTYSSKDIKTIQNGFFISIIFWFIFDILTISLGLYAAAIIPIDTLNNLNPYIYLAENYLPVIIKNIFYIGLLSVVMSTIDSYFFISSILITNDLIDTKNRFSNKVALLIIGLLSYIISMNFIQVIDIWYIFGSIAASSILIPFLIIIFKPNKIIKYPIITLTTPIFVSLIWIYLDYPYGIDLMYPGVLTSGLLSINNYEK